MKLKGHTVIRNKWKLFIILSTIYYCSVSSDFLSTEKELDASICYLYGQKIIQDRRDSLFLKFVQKK